MLPYLLSVLATALALLVVDIVLPGVNLANFPAALLAGVIIGVVNGAVKPFLQLVSLPVTILTFGLFALVVNGFCFWLASVVTPGFQVSGFLGFLIGPIILSVGSTFLNGFLAKETGESTAIETGD
ncbi:hypothetical protein C7271_02855 [filamentous cyanobacterium CCP5]|nr:hypothetical protein C7271_02855 [filamentous cyanobacterium CCP5]